MVSVVKWDEEPAVAYVGAPFAVLSGSAGDGSFVGVREQLCHHMGVDYAYFVLVVGLVPAE